MGATKADIKSIFGRAMALSSSAERAAFLQQACGGDAALRAEIESLLQAERDAGSFLGERQDVPVATVDEPALSERPGTVIGPYKLLEQIGEGGMGLVFVAEQTQPIRRKVALKVIKPGMDTRQVVARFEAERQALALMDHPNIAKVLDAGTTPPVSPPSEGGELTGGCRPYFVMELVRGVAITEYCDSNRLTLRERLALFVAVCQAVQHAHQKGIIHRDLKPSNVMVTLHDGVPVVKVIDFGIAKAIGQQLTDKSIYTRFTQMIGTPLYMSPEQAEMSGLDVDTRSDIYSLGVLLYELLTGTTPFDKERLQTVGYDEMRRIIREEEPPKPSTRISTLGEGATPVSTQRKSDPKRLRQLLRGELDWIVMKALEKDRNRRYETASAFALDVQHYLHDEPVLACPPSAWYRFGKFARRNRLALAIASVATAALILMVGGLSAGVVLLGRANARTQEQRDLAQENFRRALQAVDDYFTQVSESTLLKSPLPGLQPLRRQLLQTALTYYQGFAQQHHDDPALQAELARAYFRVALISEELGAKADALKAYREACDAWEKLRQDDPANPTYLHELAQSYGRLGSLQSKSPDEGENALASLQQACALAEAVAGASPDQRSYQKTLAENYRQLGRWYQNHESPEALPLMKKALGVWEQLAQDEPELELQVAWLLMEVGYYLAVRGEPKDALAFHGRCRELVEKWARQKPTDFEIRRLLRFVYKNLGYVHEERTRNYEQARDYYAKVLELDEQLARENPAVFQLQWLWAGDLWQMGGLVYDRISDYAKAAALAREALERFERLDREHPHDPEIQLGLGRTYLLYSKAQAKSGHPDEAIRFERRLRDLLDHLGRDRAALAAIDSVNLGYLYSGLGFVQQETGQTAEALHSFAQAVEFYRKVLIASPRHIAQGELAGTYCAQGVLQRRAGQLPEALHSLQEARALFTKLPSPNESDHYDHAVACAQLSLLVGGQAEKRKLTEEAMDALRQALAAGFTRVAELRTSPDLDPLRSRKDFQKLLAGLGKKR
jgi:serine/threonine protein kinase/tetratricopeptide (TPR) repeat protein